MHHWASVSWNNKHLYMQGMDKLLHSTAVSILWFLMHVFSKKSLLYISPRVWLTDLYFSDIWEHSVHVTKEHCCQNIVEMEIWLISLQIFITMRLDVWDDSVRSEGLAKDSSNSNANALELLQSYAKPLMYASVNGIIIGSRNGPPPVQHQAITWTNADLLSTGAWGTYCCKTQIKM